MTLVWKEEGDYPFPYETVSLQPHGFSARQVWVDGREVVADKQRLVTGPFQEVRLRV